jgi:hypothetical protein
LQKEGAASEDQQNAYNVQNCFHSSPKSLRDYTHDQDQEHSKFVREGWIG